MRFIDPTERGNNVCVMYHHSDRHFREVFIWLISIFHL